MKPFSSLLLLIFFFRNGGGQVCGDIQQFETLLNSTSQPPTDATNNDTNVPQSPSKSIPLYILPKSLLPYHYDLELQPYLTDESVMFSGDATVWFTCVVPTSVIVLHSVDLLIYSVELQTDEEEPKAVDRNDIEMADMGTNVISDMLEKPIKVEKRKIPKVINTTFNEEREIMVVQLNAELTEGKKYGLRVLYNGQLNECMRGFCSLSYTLKNGQTRWIALSQFEPMYARRAFPCFDEPAMKATFNITLVRMDNMTSLSNMPKWISEPRENGWVADHFQKSVLMPTYTVAFIVVDFECSESFARKTMVRVCANEDSMNFTTFALETGSKTLLFLEDYLNVSYPLPKLDFIAIPNVMNFGAMENWGLVTFRDMWLLYDTMNSTMMLKLSIRETIAHEVAHQWFGNLVTMKWWNDIWLNEGIATYMEYVILSELDQTSRIEMPLYYWRVLKSLLQFDTQGDRPVSLPVDQLNYRYQIFGTIVYRKGAAIARILEGLIGLDNFQRALAEYMNEYQFKNTVQDDLWRFMTKAVHDSGNRHLDVKRVMDTWTLQTGYPLITVIRNYNNNTAIVTQTYYKSTQIPDKETNSTSKKWEVPLTYTNSVENKFDDIQPRKWLHQEDEYLLLTTADGVPATQEWMLFNLHYAGYYRVNYDSFNWKLLIQQLLRDHTKIPVVNRAQIIGDIFSLVHENYLPAETALSVVEYLFHETEILPWLEALPEIQSYLSKFIRTPLYGKLKTYIKRLIEPLWRRLEEIEMTDDPLSGFVRDELVPLACEVELHGCIQEAHKEFRKWTQDPFNYTWTDLKPSLLCTALRNSDANTWETFWNFYMVNSPVTFNNYIPRILACTNDPWHLIRKSTLKTYLQERNKRLTNDSRGVSSNDEVTRYLEVTLEPSRTGIDEWVAQSILIQVGNTFNGKHHMAEFVKENWNHLTKTYLGVKFLVALLTRTVDTPRELHEVKQFLSCLSIEEWQEEQHLVQINLNEAELKVNNTMMRVRELNKWLKKSKHLFAR